MWVLPDKCVQTTAARKKRRALILKRIWKCKGLILAIITFEKRNKDGELILSNFKPYYKTTVIKRDIQINITEQTVKQTHIYIVNSF